MYVKRELDFEDMGGFLWSGAQRKWNNATEDQRKEVWDRLEEEARFKESSGDLMTETTVNDFVWFDCDDIFDRTEESRKPRKLYRNEKGSVKNNIRKLRTPDHI